MHEGQALRGWLLADQDSVPYLLRLRSGEERGNRLSSIWFGLCALLILREKCFSKARLTAKSLDASGRLDSVVALSGICFEMKLGELEATER